MEQHDIRRAALRAWIDRHHKGNVSAFAKATGKSQPHLSEMLRGERPLGERFARTLEKAAKMPDRYLEQASGGTREASSPYHGVMLTRAGAQLGAEWEKLDIDRRAHYEQLIYGEVAKKVRNSRKTPSLRHVEDEDK